MSLSPLLCIYKCAVAFLIVICWGHLHFKQEHSSFFSPLFSIFIQQIYLYMFFFVHLNNSVRFLSFSYTLFYCRLVDASKIYYEYISSRLRLQKYSLSFAQFSVTPVCCTVDFVLVYRKLNPPQRMWIKFCIVSKMNLWEPVAISFYGPIQCTAISKSYANTTNQTKYWMKSSFI